MNLLWSKHFSIFLHFLYWRAIIVNSEQENHKAYLLLRFILKLNSIQKRCYIYKFWQLPHHDGCCHLPWDICLQSLRLSCHWCHHYQDPPMCKKIILFLLWWGPSLLDFGTINLYVIRFFAFNANDVFGLITLTPCGRSSFSFVEKFGWFSFLF